jgi:hypothetical protein
MLVLLLQCERHVCLNPEKRTALIGWGIDTYWRALEVGVSEVWQWLLMLG